MCTEKAQPDIGACDEGQSMLDHRDFKREPDVAFEKTFDISNRKEQIRK